MEIIAHRGASFDAPENTLAAVRLAWAQGADAVEVDVQLTRDGRLAVIHDPDTQRTGGVGHVVAEQALDALQALDVGRWKATQYAGERIPALDEVLAEVPPGKRLFVEIKGGPHLVPELERSLARGRKRAGLALGQVVVIAFDLEAAAAAKRALPDHEVAWIAAAGAEAPLPTVEDIARAACGAGLDGVDLDAGWGLDATSIRSHRQLGLKVYVWTVDDVELARRFAVAGVDGITTNRPGWLRTQLALR